MNSAERNSGHSDVLEVHELDRKVEHVRFPHFSSIRRIAPGAVFILFFTLIFLMQACNAFQNVSAMEATGSGNSDAYGNEQSLVSHSEGGTAAGEDIADNVKLLYLYEVKDGELLKSAITGEMLSQGGPLKIEGHISGLIAFCDEDVQVYVGDQEMNKIKKNGDGSFSLKRFGTLRPEDLAQEQSDKTYYANVFKSGHDGGAFLRGVYSLFPKVTGDTVVMNDTFNITFYKDGKRFDVPVQQNGYRSFCTMSPTPRDDKCREVSFRYLGQHLDTLQDGAEDFGNRLWSIAQGIDAVEASFDIDLIDSVNILDYGKIYNAVTSEDGAEMWFYLTVFRRESIEELKAISEHETLHKYVERVGLTDDRRVRAYFADLKGYDKNAYERFLIETTGHTPFAKSSQGPERNVFFAFINEMNFLENMKGGHSHANLGEFCTSFVHSLMYVDRLEENLNRPVKLGSGEERYLTDEEKSFVLDMYVKMLSAMLDVLDSSRSPGGDAVKEARSKALVSYGLDRSMELRSRWAMGNGSMLAGQTTF